MSSNLAKKILGERDDQSSQHATGSDVTDGHTGVLYSAAMAMQVHNTVSPLRTTGLPAASIGVVGQAAPLPPAVHTKADLEVNLS